jgi:hypothetical protein
LAFTHCTAQSSTTTTVTVKGKNKGTHITEKTSGSGTSQIKIKDVSIDCDNYYDMTCYTITTTETVTNKSVVVKNEFDVPVASGSLYNYFVKETEAGSTTSVISLVVD